MGLCVLFNMLLKFESKDVSEYMLSDEQFWSLAREEGGSGGVSNEEEAQEVLMRDTPISKKETEEAGAYRDELAGIMWTNYQADKHRPGRKRGRGRGSRR
jgi:hypothetical protein